MPAPMKVLMVLCNVYTFMGSGTRMPLICTLILNDFFSYKPVCHNIVYFSNICCRLHTMSIS